MGKEEGRGDGMELNLELSLGGRYGKTENSKGEIIRDFCIENVNGVSESNFFNGVAENVCESVDLQKRKEMQALRRQEARRKREEKIKKSRNQNAVSLAEDKLFVEAQKLQARVLDRETRERKCLSEEKARKKVDNCSNGVADELSLSLSTDNNACAQQQREREEYLYPKVHQHLSPGNGFQYSCGAFPSWGNSSVEQCSSAVSDYQSRSHKGGSSSDTGSHSSRPRQYPCTSRNPWEVHERHDPCSQAGTDRSKLSHPLSNTQTPTELSKPGCPPDQTSNHSSTSENHVRETSVDGLNEVKPLKPSRMPCVSATGNGPNGRTIMGFLYKYTRTEVSIVCVCHGSSFSPAGFVEHAGGIDISQPLKYITVVRATLG